MLRNGLQVIAHYPRVGGTAGANTHCRGFLNLRTMMPSLVAFVGMDAAGDALAARLGDEFCRRVRALTGAVEATQPGPPTMPCSGLIRDSFNCHAIYEPDCHKLLVLV